MAGPVLASVLSFVLPKILSAGGAYSKALIQGIKESKPAGEVFKGAFSAGFQNLVGTEEDNHAEVIKQEIRDTLKQTNMTPISRIPITSPDIVSRYNPTVPITNASNVTNSMSVIPHTNTRNITSYYDLPSRQVEVPVSPETIGQISRLTKVNQRKARVATKQNAKLVTRRVPKHVQQLSPEYIRAEAEPELLNYSYSYY
jgi:hypothetical protein